MMGTEASLEGRQRRGGLRWESGGQVRLDILGAELWWVVKDWCSQVRCVDLLGLSSVN